jgi:protein-S-isoprenylcysteine O-methyltransferase Ste14
MLAFGGAEGAQMTSVIRHVGNLVGVIGVGVLAGCLALWLRSFDPGLGLELPAWSVVPGALLLIAGVVLVLASTVLLLSAGLAGSRGKEFFWPREFVAVGPFRHVRNPMALGAVAYLAGLGLLLRSGSVLVLAALGFAVLHVVVVFVEEPGLAKRFGQSYLEYKRQVPRWVPLWRPSASPPPNQPSQQTGAVPSIPAEVKAPEGGLYPDDKGSA